MKQNIEVRKIPRKHLIAIFTVIFIGIAYYLSSTTLKAKKLQEILATLGHKNTTDVVVFRTHKVEDQEVRKKGTLYSLKFTDLDLQQECKGFVLYDYKKVYSKDIECK